jgi:AAA+ ATPase superfamily predicted ATPase
MYDETRNLLSQEFSDITLVNNIVEQIASGENTVNVIATRVGEKDSTVLYSLEKLIEVGLVEKKRCITEEKNKKKTQYVLRDNMFKFWYEFIPKAHSVIELGQGDIYYEKVVKSKLHSFMGSVFEDMCRYYTLEQGVNGRFGGFITNVGIWWGNESFVNSSGERITQPADIDVVAISDIDKTAVIGECKFKNEKIDKGVYETLIRRSSLISGKYKISKYVFFSLSGYTDWFDTITDDTMLLLSLKDLYD